MQQERNFPREIDELKAEISALKLLLSDVPSLLKQQSLERGKRLRDEQNKERCPIRLDWHFHVWNVYPIFRNMDGSSKKLGQYCKYLSKDESLTSTVELIDCLFQEMIELSRTF